MAIADEAGLDLIEISPQAVPPVCKVLDYGKYKYEVQKRKNEAKKNQKVVEIKELKLRPMIDTHDYEVKIKQAKKFLSQGNKVKFTMRYKGREMSANDMGREVLNNILEDLEGLIKVDSEPKLEGRQMMMVRRHNGRFAASGGTSSRFFYAERCDKHNIRVEFSARFPILSLNRQKGK